MALGEAYALLVQDKGVVEIGWLWKAQQGLEDAVDVGGGEEVLAAGDVGDLLEGIVHHDGEVVGGANVLAGQDDIAEQAGIDGNLAVAGIGEGKRAGDLASFSGIEPPRGLLAGGEAGVSLILRDAAAGAGVECALGAVGGADHAGDFVLDLPAGAEAGVGDSDSAEVFQRFGVGGSALGLV